MDRHRLPGVHVDRPVQAARVHGGAYRERTEDLDAAVRLRPKGVFFTRSVYLAKAEGREVGGGFEFPGYGSLAARWLQADTDDPVWAMWNAAMERAALKAAGKRAHGRTTLPRDKTRACA